MSEEIYHRAIKELAVAAHGAGRLHAPDASAQLDNPLCGDRIALDVRVENGRILAIAHETRGCLLCRAAASLIGQAAPGLDGVQLGAIHAEIAALLRGELAAPARWPDFRVFTPVRAHRSRHGCVLLPFQALESALAGQPAVG